jgi:DNA-binding response OmpR family regulator
MEMVTVRRVCIPVGEGKPGMDVRRAVLLVTSDTGLREAGARVLEAEGYRVIPAAHSGHALLACLTETRIDILAADLTADDLAGPGLAQRVRRHFPDIQTLYFAHDGTPESEGVLVRPFTRDDLLAALELVSTFGV